jgi:photosystem II stability/assembly factor-like uncharacterized protein
MRLREEILVAGRAVEGTRRFCTGHQGKANTDSGAFIKTANGGKRWVCALCLERRKKMMEEASRVRKTNAL